MWETKINCWTIGNNNNNNNNGFFICIAARMLDYTISATQDSAYNITQIIKHDYPKLDLLSADEVDAVIEFLCTT